MSTEKYDSVIVDITEYVFRYRIESEKAWENARIALSDAVGCAIETVWKSESCRKLIGPAIPRTFTFDGFRLPGTAYQTDPIKGAFDMATIIRYLDHNDAIAGADWGHPSDNIGAILAVMDWLSRSVESGKLVHTGPPLTIRTLLTAIIKAYEIQGCFLLHNAFNSHGLDHVILVKLASTALVCWLLGLTETHTMAAISHVWMDGHPLRVYRSGSNTTPRKGWAAGEACMKAVQLAFLVREGQPGSPTVLTMPRWGFYATMFGGKEFTFPINYSTWVIEHVFFKVMPVEGHGVAAVEAALIIHKILRQHSLSADKDIKSIEIRTNAAANMIINKSGRLRNSADRDHCMQYLVALAFLKGEVPEPEDFLDNSPWANDSVLNILRDRILIRTDDQLTHDYMDLGKKSLACGVTVHLINGEVIDEVLVEFPVGHVANPHTAAAVKRKFLRNMSLMFTMEEIENITSSLQLDHMKVSHFVDLLVRENIPTLAL
uniref:2-methylcitrate dehydratase n=1 Tax=Paecilomyces fulvus TaxID=89137 RepID=A0A172WCV4_9EURO|nr:2-methylcitrate dehydratase [Paecilomyces fulvus]